MLKAPFMKKETGYPQLWSTREAIILESQTSQPDDCLVNTLKWDEGAGDSENHDLCVEQGGGINTHDAPISSHRMWTNSGLHEFVAVGAEDRFKHGLLARRTTFAAIHRFAQFTFDE